MHFGLELVIACGSGEKRSSMVDCAEKRGASWGGTSGFGGVQHLVGHEDGVDDVDDAVGLEDIGRGDDGHSTLCVGDHDLAIRHGNGEIFTLNGLEHGLAATLLDHASELFGTDATGDDVIGEDLV